MCVTNINICKYLVPNYTNMGNFHSVEVMGRGSETQPQVGENLNNNVAGKALTVLHKLPPLSEVQEYDIKS